MAGPASHFVQDAPRFRRDEFGSGRQQEGIEISLNADVFGQPGRRFGKIDSPIDAEDMRAGIDESVPVSMGAFGENDDGHAVLQGCDDLLHPASACGFKIGVGQDATETIKNLDRIGSGVNLKVQELRDSLRKLFQQLVE